METRHPLGDRPLCGGEATGGLWPKTATADECRQLTFMDLGTSANVRSRAPERLALPGHMQPFTAGCFEVVLQL